MADNIKKVEEKYKRTRDRQDTYSVEDMQQLPVGFVYCFFFP